MRILLLLGILVGYCANAQDDAQTKSKKLPKEEYIIKKDSSKLVGNVTLKKGRIFMDDKEYEVTELLGYKEGKHYHAIFGNTVYWVWALGKVQAYSNWQTIGTRSEYDKRTNTTSYTDRRLSFCYIRKDTGALIMYTTQNLYDIIKDNEDAVKEFNRHYKKINNNIPTDMAYQRLTKVLAVYNGNEVVNY
jgi:hypothetical protein